MSRIRLWSVLLLVLTGCAANTTGEARPLTTNLPTVTPEQATRVAQAEPTATLLVPSATPQPTTLPTEQPIATPVATVPAVEPTATVAQNEQLPRVVMSDAVW